MSESSFLTFLFYYLCAELIIEGTLSWWLDQFVDCNPPPIEVLRKSMMFSQFLELHKIFLWQRNARLPRYFLCMGDFAYPISVHMWEKSSDQWKSGDDKFHIWKISSVVGSWGYNKFEFHLPSYVFQNSCDGWTRNRNLIININAKIYVLSLYYY